MTYLQIYNKLEMLADQSKQVAENLDKTLIEYGKQYLGEYYKEMAQKVDMEAKAQIEELGEQAQSELDKGLKSYQEVIDIQFFNDITPQIAAELETIAAMSLDINELNAYVRKFKDNGAAMRRLEKIAEENNLKIDGKSYSKEVDYRKSIENYGQQVVNAIKTGHKTRLTIALNLMQEKVSDYSVLENKEITVKQP